MKQSIIILLILSTTILKAQEINYGFKLGNNFSTLKGDDSKSFNSKNGLYFAGLYRYKSSSFFGFETGLSYSNLGANADVDTSKITIGYLDVPYILRYDVYYGVNIQAGVELSLKVHSKIGNNSDYFEDNIKFGDIRYVLGVGYEFQSGLSFDILYKAGFSTIMTKPEEDYYSSSNTSSQLPQLDLKNSAILITIGYFFN